MAPARTTKMLLILLCSCTAVTQDCGCPPPAASEGLVAAWLASPTVGVGPHLLRSLHELGWQVRHLLSYV
jgi:hypothetical protein